VIGAVNDEGEPFLQLSIAGRDWRAVVDTGFNGDLELPISLLSQIPSRYNGQILSILAGGQKVVEASYRVELPFDGRTVQAEATFANGNTLLLGTHFRREYRLQIDFVARTLLLDRVTS
jgi:predicted aspartyl protease